MHRQSTIHLFILHSMIGMTAGNDSNRRIVSMDDRDDDEDDGRNGQQMTRVGGWVGYAYVR